ncbi:kinetochore-associated protein 1 [Spea bombifrons]|uniref:kinetochore-associated protein 1 n=1 Tax=Spea bombifrons TaxID=233779 RepID=UPI00234BA660|nr:kinetochore-associated protein 1 [Spea bombifrons]
MWNDIELLANDDTGSCRLNIDSRQESGTALYQVDTLLKISSSEQVLSSPKLYACNSSEGCIVVADRSVSLLDSICQSLLLQLQFDTEVDVVGLCCEGQFLLVGERNGNIHLIHVQSRQILITKALIQGVPKPNFQTYQKLLIERDTSDEGVYNIFVLTNGGLYCIMYFHLERINKAIETMDVGSAKELEGKIKTCFISTEEYHTDGCLNLVIGDLTSDIHLIIGGKGDYVLSKWKMDPVQKHIAVQNLEDSSIIRGARKFQVLDNLLFVLDEDDILSVWDVYTLILIWDWPTCRISDFLLTTEGDSSSSVTCRRDTNLKLIALTCPNEKQLRSLAVYSLPTMNHLYSVEVSDVATLVQTGISMDTIYLLEGIRDSHERSPDSPVSVLALRCLTEALPENRLSRLLHKHKFEEAEKFAIQFGLDVELVYKVKLNIVLEKLASASIGSYGQILWQELVDEAKQNLHKIKDDNFVVEYCINAPWPTYETTFDMLNYAKTRVLKKDEKTLPAVSEEISVSITDVLKAQARLTTFYGAFGPEKFSGIAWIEFLNNEDILKDIFYQLEELNLPCAQYLWLRHQAEFESSFNEKTLENLLNMIPANIPSQELCLWFKNVLIPFVRRVVPKGQKIMAKWLEHRARGLELTDKANWPENGYQMAEVYFVSKNPADLGIASSWLWVPLKEDGDCEEVHQLMNLVTSLQELVDLYRKYNCRLALSDFEKETTTTIVFRMLDKVLAPELIPSTLEKVIRPYMYHHNLQEEELLLQYIKDLLERCSSRSASLFETAWEAKAMAVLSCMSDTDLIFDAVLQIMYGAVVPWSDTVEQLVKQHLEMDHPKVKLLQESYRLMEMNKLLRGYGIRGFNFANDKQIMGLAKYILKQDSPSSLEDALKIVQAYMLPTVEVYIFRMVQLIYMNRGEECLNLLKSLSPAETDVTVERLSLWARIALQESPGNAEECKEVQKLIAKALVEILKFQLCVHRGSLLKREIFETNLQMFEAISSLQEDFDIFLSLEEYENRSLMSQLRDEHIRAYESTRSKSKSEKTTEQATAIDENAKTPSTESRLYRLALLLQVTEQELGAELALRALGQGKVEKSLQICRDLYEHHCNPQTGHLVYLVSQKLCQMLEANTPMVIPPGMNLPAVIYQLSCQASTICSPDLLLDALELCKYTQVAMEFYRQCQIEDYGFITKSATFGADRDQYEEWTYDDFFSEDGIVLDPLIVLPVTYDITTAVVPSTAGRKMYPLDCASLANSPFIKGQNLLLPAKTPITALLENLQECSQCELTLNLVVKAFGTCLQHGVSNNMDNSLSLKLHDEKLLVEIKTFISAFGEKTVTLIKSTAMALLHKVFNCRIVDCDLALGYCTLLSKEEVFEKLWDIISNTWQNYNKVMAVAVVGAQLALLYHEDEERKKFQELITDAEWGIRLGNFGVSFQSVFRQSSEKKKELLSTLVQNSNVDTALILKYCSTFMLDCDAALQLYIETLLLSGSNLKRGDGDFTLDSNQCFSTELVLKAKQIIPLLQCTQDLVVSLSAILHKLDPYDYETIEGVLQVVFAADEKNTNIQLNQALGLINHLKSYKRISPPVDLEHQYILEHGIAMSSHAQTRLPFHLLFFSTASSFWGIISAELSEESFPTLLLISKLMKVSLDTLYMTAVKHIFEKQLRPKALKMKKNECASILTKETAKTVMIIQSYLQSISNPEWAAAIAHRIAQELPTGPDKIHALKFCLCLAEKWKNNISPKEEAYERAEVLIKKLSVQYQRSATENILITHKLDTTEFLKLIGKPANLIVSLYEHSSVEKRIRIPTGRDYPDIHSAAKQISDVNNMNMSKIQNVLLEKWLCPVALPQADKNKDAFGDVQGDEDLRRVIYLLQPYPVDHSSRILYAVATSATSPIGDNQLTFAHRSRALQCLIHLADTDTVVSLVKKPIDQVKYYLKCCIYLSEFEILNIPYTLESFHSSPKEGMIKGLWKNHSHEPRAVRLVTELSLEYHVYDPQLWSGLLQKLLGFNMMNYLRKVLAAITGVQCLWEIQNFSRAWRTVILAPFISASCPPSPSQVEECYQGFLLLLKCPVLADLDLVGIAKQYAQVDLPAFTLGCLLLIPHVQKREQQIQGFLSSCKSETVLQQVTEYMSTGEVAGFASQIKDLILDNIVERKQFEKIVKTKHFNLLKLHLFRSNRVRELADYFVHRNCLDDAAEIVTEYLKSCGKPFPRNSTSLDIVQAFLSGHA